jgi:hypothetical protein
VDYKDMLFLAESWTSVSRQTMKNDLSRNKCTFQAKLPLSTRIGVWRDCLEIVVLWMYIYINRRIVFSVLILLILWLLHMKFLYLTIVSSLVYRVLLISLTF